MGRQLTGVDIATLVFGSIMLVLTIGLMATAGSMFGEAPPDANFIQLGVGSWYLLTSVLALAAGATGHKGPYIAVIVLTVLATFIALAGGFIAIAVVYWGLFEEYRYYDSLSVMIPIYPSYVEPGKSTGIMAINFITFVIMIVLSSLGCAGSCCVTPTVRAPNTLIVTTSGGYTAVPPAYVVQPPQHNFQGISNPNYTPPTVMETQKQ